VVVINNDGTEEGKESIEKQLERFPVGKDRLSIIHSGSNLGWMGAHNLALKQCTTPYVCLLNDDVIFIPYHHEFWRELTRPLNDPRVGAVGPSSNFVMGTQNIHTVDLPSSFITTLLIGFCVVMRTDLIKHIGGLDETLPGGDDLDWSIRIRDAGYKLVVVRNAYLHHIGQQTGRRVKGDEWDSIRTQDITNNALIRKHGVQKWYDTYCARWEYLDSLVQIDTENDWYKDAVENAKALTGGRSSKGLSLGCGARSIDGTWGLDIKRPGEHGAGGNSFDGATPNITADAITLPVANNSLDYLTVAHLFEHLLNPFSALAEWDRVLRPGGVLIMTVPNQEKMNTIVLDYTHLHAYTPNYLTEILELCGWEVVGVEDIKRSGAFGVVARTPHGITAPPSLLPPPQLINTGDTHVGSNGLQLRHS